MGQNKELSYMIEYTKNAEKFFVKQENIRTQYEEAIRKLLTGDRPEEADVKRIKGKRSAFYRIRIGGWRVIYMVINGKIVVVTTLLAGAGGDV